MCSSCCERWRKKNNLLLMTKSSRWTLLQFLRRRNTVSVGRLLHRPWSVLGTVADISVLNWFDGFFFTFAAYAALSVLLMIFFFIDENSLLVKRVLCSGRDETSFSTWTRRRICLLLILPAMLSFKTTGTIASVLGSKCRLVQKYNLNCCSYIVDSWNIDFF